jgi:hypothetical protein
VIVVPHAIATYLEDLSEDTQRLLFGKTSTEAPKTFGVYLGSFNDVPTDHELSLLRKWDLVIVDPSQRGVWEAVSSHCASKHILGRVEVGSIARSIKRSDNDSIIKGLGLVSEYLHMHFRRITQDSVYTAVLLADWQTTFSPLVCNELVKFIQGLGLDVYLEISSPEFISESDCRQLNMELFKGVVCRNGAILEDGDRRNCFQMRPMQPIIRAVAAQACIRTITLMMWETLPDHGPLDLAVAKRSFVWYQYYSAISWIGPRAALSDATVACSATLADEPLSALMWLKNDKTIDTQEVWRLNDSVRQFYTFSSED